MTERMTVGVGSPRGKRERSASFNKLYREENHNSIGKIDEKIQVNEYDLNTGPLMAHLPGESKASYFSRLRKIINESHFTPVQTFEEPGIYVYKRPVRSAGPEYAALLAQAGTVFHHVVIYVKQRSSPLVAIEFGPNNAMDITQNLLAEAPAGPVLLTSPELPEKQHLPMMHIAGEHHPIDAAHVKRALEFASKMPYQALRNNCIAFADFIVRVLTGNRVRSAPLIFDPVVGKYPEIDSPLLPLIQTLSGMSWHEIADGSRLMKQFVEMHGTHCVPPVGQQETSRINPSCSIEDGGDALGDKVLERPKPHCSKKARGIPSLPARRSMNGGKMLAES